MYSNKHNFAPRIGIAKNLPRAGLVFRAAYAIFFTPVDENTWCNQRHNVPYVFPETQQAENFTPPAALFTSGLNFGTPVLGNGTLEPTTVSFTAFDPNAPAQHVQQWNTQLEKSFGGNTTLAVGYLGARGFHLQRAHLINNAPPGPSPIGPRRRFKTLSFVNGTVLTPSSDPDAIIQSQTFPVSTMNHLEDTAQSWYDAAYVNVRRRYSHGLSFLANYTFAKTLTNAPDFRSPMDEAAIPQNNSDLAAEKGPACDVRHRLALSSVFDIPAYAAATWTRLLTEHWHCRQNLPGAIGNAFNHLCIWRHRKLRHGVGRKSHKGQPHRPTGIRSGHAHSQQVVQSSSIRGAARIHVWQYQEELGLGSSTADSRLRPGAHLPSHRKDQLPVPGRGLQYAK